MEAKVTPLIKKGWLRALIYLFIFFIIGYAAQVLATFLLGSAEMGTEAADAEILNLTLLTTIQNLLLLALTFAMRKFVDRKSFHSLGFAWKGYENEAGLGFFSAIATLGLGTLILIALQYLAFIQASVNFVSLLLELALFVEVAFMEELIVRGYILNNLMQSMNKWVALTSSSLVFTLFHAANPDITLFALANIFIAGFLLGLNYIYTKNLWFGIFFHFAWNYFQGPILGYDVSGIKLYRLFDQSVSGPDLWTGGPFGFEGSLLCFFLILISILILRVIFNKRYSQIPS